MTEEVETIDGYDIPKRKLTNEEQNRDVTLERLQEWHYKAGEDFCDTISSFNGTIFGGWLMGKYPAISAEILKELNSKYPVNAQPFMDLSVYTNSDGDDFYTDFAEFVNLTGACKRRVNELLIILCEYYED